MNINDLQNLDPNNIGNWPTLIKGPLILLLCAAVLGAGYWFDTQNQILSLENNKKKEGELKLVFENKQRKAANLKPLRLQLEEMKQTLGDLLQLLPNKTEIEGLLVDISQAGLATGLEFDLFKPGAEQPAEFYAIQPIQIKVTGTYHALAEYVSAVAALPRIVTQHDIAITPRGKGVGAEVRLSVSLTARTYRYLEEDESE
jgi:type IV pilus assembly protein PilO